MIERRISLLNNTREQEPVGVVIHPDNTFAVIGAGQIGSRHLQALALTQGRLYVIDPSPKSLRTAGERIAEIRKADNSAVYAESIDALPREIDVAIIATSADRRLEALRQLLDGVDVRSLILEKVLFQRSSDYTEAGQLLRRHNVPAWVNCPRRVMPDFVRLAQLLANRGAIRYRLTGRNWGLGCNAIHYIDHLAMLVRSTSLLIDVGDLEPTLFHAKRSGYVEFGGALKGTLGDGEFEFQCAVDDGAVELATVIEADDIRVTCHLGSPSASVESAENTSEIRLEVVPQSRLSHHIAEELLASGGCGLPTYEESAALHLPLIAGLAGFVRDLTGDDADRVEIT